MAALRFFFYLLMKPATLGMAFIGISGVFAPYTNPNSWWIPALAGLFMPGIIFANLYLFIFWAICKKWWVLLPLITIICNYNYFTGIFQSPWKEDISYIKDNEITIASYNVEGFFWIARNVKYNIKKVVEDNQIDILCIQEHCEEPQQDSIAIKERFGLPYRCVFFNRQEAWANFGITIYSRYPIIRYGEIDFNSKQNNSMWADILIKGDTIRVFNNHLQTTNVSPNSKKYEKYKSVKDWKGQARTLVTIVEQLKENFNIRANQSIQVRQIIDTTRYPVIVCGDFNDTPVSFAYNHIAGKNITDGFRDRGKGYGHSFNGIKGLLRIDFIGYNESFIGLEYQSPRLSWSDHNPIIMKVELKKDHV
ncbi:MULTISPECIES: endonuclease/exonuclease/phosphatase family protein [Butyricimonas]|uniref:endonuclease/exonuclease/phosphatase family protein n=1 Tax=Butyricimonas TaxID=574697 RepID=UPI001D06BA5F|nr:MULTISPECIES: endonuclease/exonuclease/phosphatase family protein [Butyricimonas]MCB6972388.1 endonuclease/exonuclease/phosphatase family protein [Butyricimonas synergistica]MCG4519396.1 endonuclease/exonuclease/phosphatase family protein [Butyricimonas sp. DFI.6.44]